MDGLIKNSPSHSTFSFKGQAKRLNSYSNLYQTLQLKKMNEFLYQKSVKGTWHIIEVTVIEAGLQIIQKSTPIFFFSIIHQTICIYVSWNWHSTVLFVHNSWGENNAVVKLQFFSKKRLKQFLLGLKDSCASSKKVMWTFI